MPGHWTRRSLTAAICSVPSLAGVRTPLAEVQSTKYGSASMTSESVELRVGGLKTVREYNDEDGANFSFTLKGDKEDISPPMFRVATSYDSEYLYRFLQRDFADDYAEPRAITNASHDDAVPYEVCNVDDVSSDCAVPHTTLSHAESSTELSTEPSNQTNTELLKLVEKSTKNVDAATEDTKSRRYHIPVSWVYGEPGDSGILAMPQKWTHSCGVVHSTFQPQL